MSAAMRYFAWGEACLFASILLCIILIPDGLYANDGISFYSSKEETVIPYSIGLLMAGWFCVRFSNIQRNSFLKFGFRIMAVMLGLMVVLPYGINYSLEYSHTVMSIFLFFVQLVLALVFFFVLRKDLVNLVLIFMMILNSFITVMYLSPEKGYLLQGEVGFQVLFAIIGYRSIKHVSTRVAAKEANFSRTKKAVSS